MSNRFVVGDSKDLADEDRRMKISVALCVYNGEKYLEEQLFSFSKQTLQPNELVVCDDGSTDQSIPIVERYAETVDFPVRIHVNERNLGSTKNFERAMSLCAGDLIALADQDDRWLPDKLELLHKRLQQAPDACGAFSDAEMVDEAGESLGYSLWESIGLRRHQLRHFEKGAALRVLSRKNVVTGATMVLRRNCLAHVLPFPNGSVHDAWLALVLCGQSRLLPVSRRLVEYRQHGRNQIGARRITWLDILKAGRPESRRPHYRSLAAEASEALERLDGRPGFDDVKRALLEGRRQHYMIRGRAAESVLRRFTPLLRELLSGRYHKHSRGVLGFVRDLLAT